METPQLAADSSARRCSAVFGPFDRVMVFDHRLFRNDRDTPISVTVKPATVLRVYRTADRYADLVMDVRFDNDGRESKGHFVDGVERLTPNPRRLGTTAMNNHKNEETSHE